MNPSISIIIGVVSGILSYILLVVFSKIFNYFIIPWYQSVIYHGRNIGGIWYGYFAEIKNGEYVKKGISRSTINLIQNANKITGKILITRQEEGQVANKSLVISGLFYDNNLIIDFKAEDQSRMSGGTYVMSLINDGRIMQGKLTFVSAYDARSIFTRDEIWVRNNPDSQNE